jgi:hypothetical protein
MELLVCIRRWRADFAYLPGRVLIEVEGGIWVNGRHNRAAGFNADLEKYLAAGLAGWRVFRFGPDQITLENVERMAEQVRDEIRRFSTESTLDEKPQIVGSELLDANQAVKKSGKLKFAFAWNLRGGARTRGHRRS